MRSNGVAALGGCWFRSNMALSARYDRFRTDLSYPTTAITRAQVCFSHMLSSSRDFSYRVQYGHTFYADASLADADQVSVCLILRFGAKL